MIEPTESDIGRAVVYRGEVGVISSFNSGWVFVRYGEDIHSEATLRRDLEWSDDLVNPDTKEG